jgi:hypothetical protein
VVAAALVVAADVDVEEVVAVVAVAEKVAAEDEVAVIAKKMCGFQWYVLLMNE